eukprot:comp18710_c0_seq1/m.20452 comp18710_c0_seq1/g.20452  ORF comp18710_c0_seq1/g.20452 comp18710_c0_seq1/m.20452 type:complete len:195 (-) comp18710_c0_seq1:77-661(-)
MAATLLRVLCALWAVAVGVTAIGLQLPRGGEKTILEAAQNELLKDDPKWERCRDLKVVGRVCVDVYAIPANLTIGLRLTVRGMTVYDREIEGDHVCADERVVLRALEKDPALAPYKLLIEQVIKIDSQMPGKLFYLCIQLSNLTKTEGEISGCVELNTKVFCLKGPQKCTHEKRDPLGCFHIPLRHHMTPPNAI